MEPAHVLVFSFSPKSPGPPIPNELVDTPDAAATESWMLLTQRPTATQPIPIPKHHAAHTFDRIEAIYI
jgi:hypothetical protein